MTNENERSDRVAEEPHRPARTVRGVVRDRANLADSPIAALTRMIRELTKDAQRRKE